MKGLKRGGINQNLDDNMYVESEVSIYSLYL